MKFKVGEKAVIVKTNPEDPSSVIRKRIGEIVKIIRVKKRRPCTYDVHIPEIGETAVYECELGPIEDRRI